jgi:hypothetical protein
MELFRTLRASLFRLRGFSMLALIRIAFLPLLALVFWIGNVQAAPSQSKTGSTQKAAPKPTTAPVKSTAKPPAKTTAKPTTKSTAATRTYIAGGKDGPCACAKGKSCRDGAGKRYCVESSGRKRIIG